jgi:hypothetical protein
MPTGNAKRITDGEFVEQAISPISQVAIFKQTGVLNGYIPIFANGQNACLVSLIAKVKCAGFSERR